MGSSEEIAVWDGVRAEMDDDPWLIKLGWEDLPEEIMHVVLSKLSLTTVLRARAVCRMWYTAVHTINWSSFPPFCVTFTHGKMQVYDTGEQKWYDWEKFTRLPPSILTPDCGIDCASYQVVSAAGSLLLLESKESSHFTVFNPINKSFKHLSRASQSRDVMPWMTIGGTRVFLKMSSMAIDKGTQTWKIFTQDKARHVSQPWKIFDQMQVSVYDANVGSWDLHQVRDRILNNYNSGGPVLLKDRSVYYLAEKAGNVHRQVLPANFLKVFHLDTKEIQVLQKLEILGSADLDFAHLFENRGRIMLLGAKMIAFTPGVFLWQLDEMSMNWLEISRMPADLLCIQANFPYHAVSRPHWKMASSGDTVGILQTGSKQGLILFNLVTRRWSWSAVPGWAETDQLMATQFIREFVMFQPNVNVFV